MAMHKQVRGVGPRSGIFIAGKPTTMLVLDDSIVLIQASTLGAILGAQGLIGAVVGQAQQRRQAKALDAAGDDMTGAQFADQKRARVISYADITSARLEGGKRPRKLTIEAGGSATPMKFPAKTWPDDDAVPFLSQKLGERFTNAVG